MLESLHCKAVDYSILMHRERRVNSSYVSPKQVYEKPERKQWSNESMAGALKGVEDSMGVREAARLYNLPYETLGRR